MPVLDTLIQALTALFSLTIALVTLRLFTTQLRRFQNRHCLRPGSELELCGLIWALYMFVGFTALVVGSPLIFPIPLDSAHAIPIIAIALVGLLRALSVTWDPGVCNILVAWLAVNWGGTFFFAFQNPEVLNQTIARFQGSPAEILLILLTLTLYPLTIFIGVELMVWVWNVQPARRGLPPTTGS